MPKIIKSGRILDRVKDKGVLGVVQERVEEVRKRVQKK